jgi:4-aminobutyrate aminotransferase-like enzyme
MKRDEILRARKEHLGRGLSLSYRDPLILVRGEGQFLFDADDRRYLDCVNNVCHVGHSHPRVVAAARRQIERLNTNTRYLHPLRAQYVTALTARFPEPLSVCYLVCTGSEAVELALRLARNYTSGRDVVAIESGYHGNTQATVDVSHYKFAGPGGAGRPRSTRVAAMPCTYRGAHRDVATAGRRYADAVCEQVEAVRRDGSAVAAFLCESMLGVGGQIVLPPDYLRHAYEAVRAAGGVCIADEVQVGFGRCGSHFWAFETQGVVPDIVVLGKGIGNGHPMAAVITTPEISEAFDDGMEYFNTFGGNPVSCAVGLAVLEVIADDGLQQHAADLGPRLLGELETLKDNHALIGDVRGRGLFLGIELVRDRDTLEPADREAHDVVEEMKHRGVLLSVDGPHHNVIKFKPPMVFSEADANTLCRELDASLAQLTA